MGTQVTVCPPAPGPVFHVLAPGPAGGLETVVRTLAQGQQGRGTGVSIVAIVDGEPHPFIESCMRVGVPVEPVVCRHRAYLQLWRSLAALFRQRSPLVVHTHGYVADVIAGSAARHSGSPVVATAHGFTAEGWRGRLYEHLQRMAFRQTAATVAVSSPLMVRLRAAGVDPSRLHLVPNALEPHAQWLNRSAARGHLGLPEGVVAVGWVGRLTREKGPDIFVDAFRLLSTESSIHGVVIGEGPLRSRLERRAEGTPLRFAGLVEDAAVLLRGLDLLVLSSHSEGTPMILLEAMAAGVPIVATAVGGIPGMLGPEEAYLVPPADPVALATAIGQALGCRDDSLGRADRARVRLMRDFTVPAWVRAYDQVYQAATADPRPGVGRSAAPPA